MLCRPVAAALVLALGIALAPVAEAEALPGSVILLPGVRTAAPARFDRVGVETFGPSRADRTLILLPGGYAGAGELELLASDIAAAAKDTRVWIVVRRDQLLEDRSELITGTPHDAERYYLDGASVGGRRFRPYDRTTAPWARGWGLAVQIADLRRLVSLAKRTSRSVFLGGHSFGAYEAAAYAAWDFSGRPGWKGLAGLVLIDGTLMSNISSVPGSDVSVPSLAGARAVLSNIQHGSPFADSLGIGVPYLAATFSAVAARFALVAPRAAAALFQSPLLVPPFKPPILVSNAALVGYQFDRRYVSPNFLFSAARFGRLAASGSPRQWIDGERSTVARVARTNLGGRFGGLAFYYPARLYLDLEAATPARRTPVTDLLGLRLRHLRSISTPLLFFGTDVSHGTFLTGVRRFVRASRIRSATLVDASRRCSHLDPLVDLPSRNALLPALVHFLAGGRAS